MKNRVFYLFLNYLKVTIQSVALQGEHYNDKK
jgi:hypothetical protein